MDKKTLIKELEGLLPNNKEISIKKLKSIVKQLFEKKKDTSVQDRLFIQFRIKELKRKGYKLDPLIRAMKDLEIHKST